MTNNNPFSIVVLTKKDLEILPYLVDSKATIKEVSKQIGLSYDTVRKRLRNLERRGILISILTVDDNPNLKLYKINPELSKIIKEML